MSPMARQIVRHDNVAGIKFGREDLLNIGLESVPVGRAIEDERRRDLIGPRTCYEGCCFPVMRLTPPRRHRCAKVAGFESLLKEGVHDGI